MEYSFILFAIIAGVVANLSTSDEKVRLCIMYAQVLLFAGLFAHGTTAWINHRDSMLPASDWLTRFLDFYQYLVPAALNLYAITRFQKSMNRAYRLISIPLSFTILYNIGVPLEFKLFGTTNLWSATFIIPALCATEVILLLVGSDVIRDKFGGIDRDGHTVRSTLSRPARNRSLHRGDTHRN